ncbi:MAG: alpha/beta hydrolase [Hirschia sp.]|nr:alpha/beta hydrolase [Hirschia sp.]MBF20011.1 alpha/beta hydrolase [Hirschia sp.]|tara:strand:- start:1407 stop:2276 length:870 start_codon:yes stop_codon:yes gene_type:complete
MDSQDIEYRSDDGLKLFARQYGRDDASHTVLCLHGLTRNHKDFEPMIAALGGDRRYIAWDTRGRGRSARDPVTDNYRNDVYANDVVRLMDELSLDKVTLVGTSMGGLISMILMNMIPDRISGVVLNDVGPKLEQAGLDRIAGYVGAFAPYDSFEDAAKAVEASQKMAFPDYEQEDWLAFAHRTFVQTARGVELDYDEAIADSLKHIRIDEQAIALGWQLFAAIKQRPLLIVRGEISDLFSEETAGEMIAKHGSATEVVVPRIGHAPIMDEPEAVAGIEQFLTSIEEAAS